MAWIKRNLFFVIGGVVAVALLGAAGFYQFRNYQGNEERKEKLAAEYAELERLNKMSPHPGNDKVDNIAAAKEQQKELREFIKRTQSFFDRIPPIPDSPKVTDEDFAAQLRKTIEQLQRDAANASVLLPPRYDFSFSSIKSKITFASSGLQPLSVQLGEIKAICDVLFRAKINSLDSLRRERVSPDDRDVVADYIELHSVTNDLAVMTPYEITFRSFSGELAGVLSGFAAAPYGFRVKSVNVEPAGAMTATSEAASFDSAPVYAPPPNPYASASNPYGGAPNPYGGAPNPYANPYGGAPNPYAAPAPVAAAAAGSRTAIVLNERPLKVTLLLELVKLKPDPKSESKASN